MKDVPGRHLTGSRTIAALAVMPAPFPDPSYPTQAPFRAIPVPDHVSQELWQDSYYEAGSHAPVSIFTKRPGGAVSLDSGRLTGEDFPDSGLWTQV